MQEAIDAFEKAHSVPQQRFPVCEEVYGREYDTAGNYHWYGTYTGHHEVKSDHLEEKEMFDIHPVVFWGFCIVALFIVLMVWGTIIIPGIVVMF